MKRFSYGEKTDGDVSFSPAWVGEGWGGGRKRARFPNARHVRIFLVIVVSLTFMCI